MITPQQLKELWVDAVRRLIGVTDYDVRGPHFDPMFVKAADAINASAADPRHFVESQVRWVISGNRSGTLYPTLLCGDGAWKRFKEAPTADQLREAARLHVVNQLETFDRMSKRFSMDTVFSRTECFSPLVLAYLLHVCGRPIDAAVKAMAVKEVRSDRYLAEFMPPEFLATVIHVGAI